MKRFVLTGAAVAAVISVVGFGGPASATSAPSVVVIGDVPESASQYAPFQAEMGTLNKITTQAVVHVGDITPGRTSGAADCSVSYDQGIYNLFNGSTHPFVYTPGDNEWTDCSGAQTGAGYPLDKLAQIRSIFFSTPGQTLGQKRFTTATQSGYPENNRFDTANVTFATIHLTGSLNDLSRWYGYTTVTAEQKAEEAARDNADVAFIKSVVSHAKNAGRKSVVFLTQADMFVSASTSSSSYHNAFQPIVAALASVSATAGMPVLLINGDTHVYKQDSPLTDPTWMNYYGITSPVPNFTRIIVQGGATEYLRLDVTGNGSVITPVRVPLG